MTKIIKTESIDSTNTYCKNLLSNHDCLSDNYCEKNITLPMAVIAAEQYAGRGCYGKSFFSPKDCGIYLSYAFEDDYEQAELQRLTIVAAAVVHQVLQAHCLEELQIKWINDIYRGSRKIAGILTERIADPCCPGKHYIIIGIGTNVYPCVVPEDLDGIVGFLADSISNPSLLKDIRQDLIEMLERVFVKEQKENFPVLINYYRNHCRNLPEGF